MEWAIGMEPTSEAWEALNKTLKAIDLAALNFPSGGLNWKLDGNQKRLQTVAGSYIVREQRIERDGSA
jgi:hypothetical protein